jgi:tetratricopeptide (TPR) repeat protein
MTDHSRIEDLRRRVQKDPASIAFAQLAEEYRREGQLEESVQVCRAGLAVHPGYLSARVTLGRALLELGQLESAQHELQMVLVGAPDTLAAIRGLAEILHRRGLLAEALTHYRHALGLARNDPELEQTVADLAREIDRQPPRYSQPPAPQPAPSGDLLTLEELTQELQSLSVLDGPALSQTSGQGPRGPRGPQDLADTGAGTARRAERPGRAADLRTLAMLEKWLAAVDGYRADRRA